MSDWPTGPVIRIIKARTFSGTYVKDTYALKDCGGGYLTDGAVLLKPDPGCSDSDRIEAWEDVTPVPTVSLTHLRDAFLGVAGGSDGPDGRGLAAIREVTSHLPKDEPSPLDRAVSQVGTLLRTPLLAPDAPSEKYLALLLSSLSALPSTSRDLQPPVLATIVQICVEWVSKVSPADWNLSDPDVALDDVLSRVESEPTVGGFPAMAALAGDSATWVDEAQNTEEGRRRLAAGLTAPVLDLAHYALALLAECLEGGE